MLKKKAFTILEVLIAAMIYAIAALGIFSTIAAMREPAAVSERTVTAAYYGRQALEDLRAKIDQRNWNSGALSIGTHSLGTTTINSTVYTSGYSVENAPEAVLAAGGLRKVILTVNWTELP